ncbi:MAG: thermonuclease family protein [Phycisphaerales bacterium]|nr:thermonuclease family protein [Phycisphaerales bacterium]
MFTKKTRNLLPKSVIVAPFWKRRPVASVIVLAIAAAAILARGAPTADDDFTKYHDRVFRVIHVADGDTFDIDIPDGKYAQTRIRLWGVDTPEVAGSRDGAMYFGAEASAFAKETLMGTRVRVLLAPERTRDKYRRLLAYVTLEDTGQSYGELLLENGLAYADWRFRHPYKSEYKRIEREARSQHIGLWADVTPNDMPEWRRGMESELNYEAP